MPFAVSCLPIAEGGACNEREYPQERDVAGEDPRVGVFVCHCGANIGRVGAVVSLSSGICYRLEKCGLCAGSPLCVCHRHCKKNSGYDPGERAESCGRRCCTPRTHEPLFRDTLREGGINPYYFEMANIREHCSGGSSDAEKKRFATRKAKDIVRMAVARTARLEPLKEFQLPVDKRALVVGGGVAGMTSARA